MAIKSSDAGSTRTSDRLTHGDARARESVVPTRVGTMALVWLSLAALALWAVFLPQTYRHNPWVFSWDSAAYMETARSLLDGRGLQQRAIDGLGRALWEPITWWTPGYSILIAAITAVTGLSLQTSGLTIAALAAAAGIVLVARLCLRLLPSPVAAGVTLTIVAMPAFLQISTQYMSDSLFFACAAAAVLGLVAWDPDDSRPWPWALFWAGFFGGAAWAVRYVGSFLLATSCVFLLLHVTYLPARRVARTLVCWGAGVVICFVPLALRNLIGFGQLNPYNMPPSELTFWDNVCRTVELHIGEMTTNFPIAWWLATPKKIVAAVVLVVLVALVVLWRVGLRKLPDLFKQYRLELLFAMYAVVYAALVIGARTRYRWGELIDRRHLIQIFWIEWILVAVIGMRVLRRFGVGRTAAAGVLTAFFAGACWLQIGRDIDNVTSPAPTQFDAATIVGTPALDYLAAHVSASQIVLSTRADLLRIHRNLNARKIPPTSQYDFLQPLALTDLETLGDDGFLWGMAIDDVAGVEHGDYGPLVRAIVADPQSAHFERIDLPGPTLVLQYVRSARAHQ
jgi:hypothetical protein